MKGWLIALAGLAGAIGTYVYVKHQQTCEFCKEEVERGDLIHALQLGPVCEACADHLRASHSSALQIAVFRGDARNIEAFGQNYELITGEPYPGPLGPILG